MTTDIMLNDSTWPVVGNPVPPPLHATSSDGGSDPNSSPPEWEMIAEEEEEHTITTTNPTINNNSSDDNDCVVVIHGPSSIGNKERRPRSATVGGEAAFASANTAVARLACSTSKKSSSFGCEEEKETKIVRAMSFPTQQRTLRRCASTPDLVVCDNAHEVIVEDESDSEEYDDDGDDDDDDDDDDDVASGSEEELVVEKVEVSGELLEESFEVVPEEHHEGAADVVEDDEPFMIGVDDDFTNEEEESATFVSTPSMGTSSWTIPSSVVPTTPPTSVWGMKKSPSFKDVLLAKSNVDGDCDTGVFGKDRALTEAKLRDPHRHHHLRVRTKPKFVIADGGSSSGSKMMRHANSTGDLTRMLSNVEEGHESSIGQGGRNRRSKKQLSAMMEEDEDGDFVIGRGSCGTNGDVAGEGSGVLGDTDAMDYYQRKEHGSRSISNKKKERPDEAKRREIIMYKKDVQRRQNGENQKTPTANGDVKKKKNEKGVGGKKERRRL
jgi:hypothetical protein